MSEPLPHGDAMWWLEPSNQKHDRLIAVVKDIRQNQGDRKVSDLLNATLYAGYRIGGFGTTSSRAYASASTRPTLNVVRNMVGAVTSKIAAKNKPKPTFLTEDGNYELREKAQMLEKFVSGVFYDSGVYAELTRCFRDACVYGTGVLKVSEGEGKVDVEAISQLEIVVDDGEGRLGQPRNLYHRRYFDRLMVRELWGDPDGDEQAKAIYAALSVQHSRDPEDIEYAYNSRADEVLITEGWHLAETRKGKGRHVIAIEGCTLLDEEWEGPFPFSFLRWSKPLEGFFGVGLAEELSGIQREINRLLMQIQRGHHLIAGHWLVENGSKVHSALLNNDLAAIVRYSGTKPSYEAPQIIAPEVYAHLWQLYAKAFEISGISQLNATGMKPAGLDSGEAQRVYQDIQTERFLEIGQDYEEFVVEAARQVVRMSKRVGGDYRVPAIGKGSVDFVSLKDIDIEEDLYVIRVYPTSLLPSTPAGKLAWAQDMIESQLMPPDDVLEVVDFPDTDAYKARKLAPRKIIERNIAQMLKTGEFVSPEPFDKHDLALQLTNEAYAQARLDGVPEAKKELLRRYMADTADFMKSAAPPIAPPAMPVGPPGLLPPEGPLPGMPAPPPMMDPAMPPPMPMAA